MLKKSLCLLRLEVKFRQAWVHRSDCFLSLGPCRESANGRCSDGLWNFFKNGGKLMDYLLEWFTKSMSDSIGGRNNPNASIVFALISIEWVFVSNLPWEVLNLPPIWRTFDRPPKMPLKRNFSSRCLWRDGRFGATRWKGWKVAEAMMGPGMILNRGCPGYFRIWKIVVGVKILWKACPKRIPQKDDSIPGKLFFLKICDWRTSKKRRSSRWNCKTLSWWKPYACVVQLPVLTVW